MWKFILLKVAGLAFLLLLLAGGLRWWKFFTQSSMKAYFHAAGGDTGAINPSL